MTTDLLEEQDVLEAPPLVNARVLTRGQQHALDKLNAFLIDPIETVFELKGYSGCGKSTLVETFLARMEVYYRTARLIDPSIKVLDVELTATTNKAAENLSEITNREVRTIQSLLGLRVQTDFRTKTSKLVPRPMELVENRLIFIDEASMMDKELLGYVFSRTKNCKVIFIGDPCQLRGIKATGTPVFSAGFSGAELTEVVRQPKKEGGFAELHPITAWAEQMRKTVETGVWTPFKPDGHHIIRMSRDEFDKRICAEFTRPDWRYKDSKILAYTNRCAVAYNEAVRTLAKGDPHFQVGDYAVCNSHLTIGKTSIKTDQLVMITGMSENLTVHGVLGNWVTMDHMVTAFQPKSLAAKKQRIKEAHTADDMRVVTELESQWVDLRGAYAQTVNKSQGSTYGSVFIDLDDISVCTNGEDMARMLYVGPSRARNHVFLTGDLV